MIKRGFSNFPRQFRQPNIGTKILIGANAIMFLAQPLIDRRFVGKHFAISDYHTVRRQQFYTIFTSSITHDDIVHVGWTVGTLWLFAPYMEAALGPMGMMGCYFAGAVGGFLGLKWGYRDRRRQAVPLTFGGSAASAAIFAYSACARPWDPVRIWIFQLPTLLVGLSLVATGASWSKEQTPEGWIAGASVGGMFYILRRLIRRY